jgi:predicted TIM-barrel fold metal-dependent hydrolase
MARKLDFPVFDADNNMYETHEAFTRHLPPAYDGLVKYVEVNGRTKIALNNVISEYIPNPTFNKVAPPGAQELEFRLKNPSSKSKPGDQPLAPPPKYIVAPPAFFEPGPRLELMDGLGIDRALMWPTLASLLEERMSDDPEATHAVIHALNQWMLEEWTYDYEGRIFATPVIAMNIIDEAIRELDYVVEHGAKVVLIRPAPVPDVNGRRRSFALPEFDPFWARVQESGVLVGMHASDDGQQRYLNEWNGLTKEFEPFKRTYTGFDELLHAESRGISDVVASIVGHGLASRFPDIRFMPVENGSAWVRPLVERMEKVYERSADVFEEDPILALKRNVIIHPFHEEDPMGLIDLMGLDNVVFGSDYPHPEGLFDPLTWVDELDGLSVEDQAKIMGGNLSRLMGMTW